MTGYIYSVRSPFPCQRSWFSIYIIRVVLSEIEVSGHEVSVYSEPAAL